MQCAFLSTVSGVGEVIALVLCPLMRHQMYCPTVLRLAVEMNTGHPVFTREYYWHFEQAGCDIGQAFIKLRLLPLYFIPQEEASETRQTEVTCEFRLCLLAVRVVFPLTKAVTIDYIWRHGQCKRRFRCTLR